MLPSGSIFIVDISIFLVVFVYCSSLPGTFGLPVGVPTILLLSIALPILTVVVLRISFLGVTDARPLRRPTYQRFAFHQLSIEFGKVPIVVGLAVIIIFEFVVIAGRTL